MDQNRKQPEQQGNRMRDQSQRDRQPSPSQWDGRDRRTGTERRHESSDDGGMNMQMNEGSDR